MQKVKVSVVIIAKNEERNIGRCLASASWADDVIVVDGFSTDRTVEIARASGARVIQHKFTGAFADDRNAGMEQAANDWVLQLDADDIIMPDFKDKMETAITRQGDVRVYKFKRVNFFLGHSMDHGGFHHYIPNLVDRRSVKYVGVVHEVPDYKGAIGTIEAGIEHHPFDSIGQFIERQNRYADIAARHMLKTEGRIPDREIRRNMIRRSFKIFFKSYLKKQGYKEGFYGLVFGVLFAFINFLKWAKYWELVKDQG